MFANNKKLLYEIFSINNYNFNTPKNKNFFENNNNFNSNEFEINYKNFNEEKIINEKLILINKDYLNKGLFCLFTKSKNIENLETLKYILIPLKPEFKTFEEKEEVKNLLNILKKTIYSNFEYYPYNSKYLLLYK